ncbi:MAG: radical SAM protein [Candidatus Gracilibacteria bacterium]|nr:radical SAM protein [Candidatus Gracilibacteria bacterium]
MKIYLIDNIIIDCTASTILYEKIKVYLEKNNHEIVNSTDSSDYVILNTCGVWKSVEEKFLKIIEETLKKDKKIIIVGCLSSISEKIKLIKGDITLIPTKQEYLLNDIFKTSVSIDEIDSKDIKISSENRLNGFESINVVNNNFFLEIARGCIHNCSYCITKKAIGYVKSVPKKKILESLDFASKNGYKNIILVSDDLTSYGKDIGEDFSSLFVDMCKYEDLKFNFNYVEPSEFLKIYPKIKHFMDRVSEITMPIQSFNDRILELMRRKYKVDEVMNLIQEIKNDYPKLPIYNHIIYGYPTETFDEFKNNIEKAKYFDGNLFNLYSYRKGTKKFDNDLLLSKEEIIKRLKILFLLNKKDSRLFCLGNKEDDLDINI